MEIKELIKKSSKEQLFYLASMNDVRLKEELERAKNDESPNNIRRFNSKDFKKLLEYRLLCIILYNKRQVQEQDVPSNNKTL